MTITLLNNRYQVIQVLGAGGFGETFLAEDTHMPSRRRCVIKQLKPISNDPQTYQIIQQRFEREAATLESLGKNSDQIPELYAYFSEKGQFYLVQEWIHGQTLRDIVTANAHVSETAVREILFSLLPVLEYIHSKGIIHRDIKPDNIIVRSPDNKPVLIDFGAVKETIRSVVTSPGIHANSMVIGTPGYMSSEQALGRPVYATDIYGLGLTAIYLLTGKQPQELETNQQTGEILWRDDAPNVSPSLAAVLEQSVKPNASDRYTTASKMLYALQSASYIAPATVTRRPTTANASIGKTQPLYAPQPQTIAPSNWQKPAAIVGSLVVGGLIGGLIISKITRQPEVETPIVQNSTPSPEPSASITPLTETPTPTPTSLSASPSPVEVVPAPIPPLNPRVESNPPDTTTSIPEQEPVNSDTPAPVATTAPESKAENPPPVVATPEARSTPKNNDEPRKSASSNVSQSIPAFPTGTSRSSVEATLGKPKKDLRGVWRNTRAVTYNVVPDQIDLGYLFDRKTGALRQTEAAFAQSVDPQVMQNTLNGMLGGQATAEIKQGLQQIQSRQSDSFQFTQGGVKGQIVRQDCDFIYISIWDADLHDFVSPASAKRCS
ncbi:MULTISPECIES: serine/threonine-protein kinase [unclassified Tolypothrix]|uniref:serine/threonine-protein kinase n=1 Tax=unclassified Tolypothrix TaxID=2649714 RepID=UPI0005EAB1CF|nr:MULTISPECIES: serine/threonine-protein kinase [unclassified Tolypothrix]BAY92253.1 serine/threonine protein kinase [Microchaete diplosiphon NIES-3275]EKE98426.1 kinase domain protein [Tolypothrix sp. PCC 7601]MBE9087307.1 protein kinase [Tolypothrix sp. LEGE 11397]UYD26226.1 protein kinase [Tolypothrix sp. PCC 7712]UYD31536.1 protein kinase [Tolypothrix sp. PCC 7601]